MFNEEANILAQRHINFLCLYRKFKCRAPGHSVEAFIQYLDGEVKKWFKSFLNDSITTWEEMENFFFAEMAREERSWIHSY